MKTYLKWIKVFIKNYRQRCIQVNNIFIFPVNFDYIRLYKVLLNERITGIIDNQLIRFGKASVNISW